MSTGFLPSGLAFSILYLTAQRVLVLLRRLGRRVDQIPVNRHAKMSLFFGGGDRRLKLTPIRCLCQSLFRWFGRARRRMLGVDEIGKIPRAPYREGRSIRGISRDLSLSRATVRKILRSEVAEAVYARRTQPKIGPWHSISSASIRRGCSQKLTGRIRRIEFPTRKTCVFYAVKFSLNSVRNRS